MTVLRFKHTLSYYLKLFDKRKEDGDMFGALDAARNAHKFAKTKIQRDSLNLLLGQALFEMKLYSLSCEYYFRALSTPQSRAGAYFGIGRNLVFLNRLNLSLNYFDKAIEWDVFGVFSQAVLDWTDVIKQKLNQKQKITQKDLDLQNIYVFARQNKIEKAMELSQKLLNQFPDDNNVLGLYANLLFLQNDISKARQIYKTILTDEPQNASARLSLMKICVLDEDFTSFFTLAQGIDVSLLSSQQLLLLAKLFSKCGNYEKSKECLQLLLKQHPYSTKVYFYLAICCYNLNQKEDALFNLAQARWIDYENPILVEYLKIFNSQQQTLELVDDLPKSISQHKKEKLKTLLEEQKFLNIWLKNENMADETDWLLSSKNFYEGELCAQKLASSSSKKAKKYCKKVLLSIRPDINQKFFLTREVLRNNKSHVVELTSNYVFRSFSFKLKKSLACISLFKNSITNAWAYIQCFENNIKLKQKAEQIFGIILKNNLQSEIDENTLTCLLFCDDYEQMIRACNYFCVDLGTIENAKNKLNIV